MGNEKSSPSGLKVEEIVKVSDDWVQKSAVLTNEMTRICVFEQHLREESVQNLQNLSKNLKLYRHPNILKYLSSWRTNKTLSVATEFGQPLSLVAQDLIPMQKCIGLFNILKAITFLQETASSSHNSISKDAVYVTSDGSWKLGKLELMTRNRGGPVDSDSLEFADQKAFAALADEILQHVTNDDIPAVEEFKQLCKSHAASAVSNMQFFRQLFDHAFFTNRFLYIYNFLSDLPAKNEAEKSTFFETLADDLTAYSEETVASILGSLLLSRLVALNGTAEKFLLPRIFTPKTDENTSLFSVAVLRTYIAPRLLKMFSVRDSQIRLLLLRHFKSFHVAFTREQLQTVILPELLVGIKDTNETLVSDTLRTLADLVPVLGASVVIGKGRAKLFADGRPFMKKETRVSAVPTTSDLTSVLTPLATDSFPLPERPSPDGGEDNEEITHARDLPIIVQKDTATTNHVEKLILDETKSDTSLPSKSLSTVQVVQMKTPEVKPPSREITYSTSVKEEEDLTTLDVKCSRPKHDSRFDDIELMFKDMEPVISRTAIMQIPEKNASVKNKFTADDVDGENFDGWGDEINNEWITSEAEE